MRNSALTRIFESAMALRKHLDSVEAGSVVMTNGCFDILHIGHLRSLEQASTFGDILVVGINSDTSVKRNKGPARPVIPEKQRAEMIAGLWPVDYCYLFEEETALESLKVICPNVYAKSADYDIRRTPEGEYALQRGIAVQTLQFHEGTSTTTIIERLAVR